jgi:hypothetical protein
LDPGVDGVYADGEEIKRLSFAAEPAEILFGLCDGIKNAKRIVGRRSMKRM